MNRIVWTCLLCIALLPLCSCSWDDPTDDAGLMHVLSGDSLMTAAGDVVPLAIVGSDEVPDYAGTITTISPRLRLTAPQAGQWGSLFEDLLVSWEDLAVPRGGASPGEATLRVGTATSIRTVASHQVPDTGNHAVPADSLQAWFMDEERFWIEISRDTMTVLQPPGFAQLIISTTTRSRMYLIL